MKLFKKLAAAMLVAALALTMVGCGSSSLLDQVKNVIADFYAMEDEDVTNKKELDDLAAKLVAEADKAAAKPGNQDKKVLELLTDNAVVTAAGIDTTQGTYRVSAVENYKMVSNTVNKQKAVLLAEMLMVNSKQIGGGNLDPSSYGFAVGKINGKEYFVMLTNGPSRI